MNTMNAAHITEPHGLASIGAALAKVLILGAVVPVAVVGLLALAL